MVVAGVDVLVLEAQGRVGGRTLTRHEQEKHSKRERSKQNILPAQDFDELLCLSQIRSALIDDTIRLDGAAEHATNDIESARDRRILVQG
jgi:monoamine oxidase